MDLAPQPRLRWVANSQAIEAQASVGNMVPDVISDDWEVKSSGMSSVPEDGIMTNPEEELADMRRWLAQRARSRELAIGVPQETQLSASMGGELALPDSKQAALTGISSSSGQSSRDRYGELIKQAQAPLQSEPSFPTQQSDERKLLRREVDVELDKLREIEERIQRNKTKATNIKQMPQMPQMPPPDAVVEETAGSKVVMAEMGKWQAEAEVVAKEKECDMLREQLNAEVSKRRELEAYAKSMEELIPIYQQRQAIMEDRTAAVLEEAATAPSPKPSPRSGHRQIEERPASGTKQKRQWQREMEAKFFTNLQNVLEDQKVDAAKALPVKDSVDDLPDAEERVDIQTLDDQTSVDTVEAITERLNKAESAFVQQQRLFNSEWTNLKQQLSNMQASKEIQQISKIDQQASPRSTPPAPHAQRLFSQPARSASANARTPSRQISSPVGRGHLIWPRDARAESNKAGSSAVARSSSIGALSVRYGSQETIAPVNEAAPSSMRRNINNILNTSSSENISAEASTQAVSSVTVLTKPVGPASLQVPAGGSLVLRMGGQHTPKSAAAVGKPTGAEVQLLTDWIAKAVSGDGPDVDKLVKTQPGGSMALPVMVSQARPVEEERPASLIRRQSSPRAPRARLSSSVPPLNSSVVRAVTGGSLELGIGQAQSARGAMYGANQGSVRAVTGGAAKVIAQPNGMSMTLPMGGVERLSSLSMSLPVKGGLDNKHTPLPRPLLQAAERNRSPDRRGQSPMVRGQSPLGTGQQPTLKSPPAGSANTQAELPSASESSRQGAAGSLSSTATSVDPHALQSDNVRRVVGAKSVQLSMARQTSPVRQVSQLSPRDPVRRDAPLARGLKQQGILPVSVQPLPPSGKQSPQAPVPQSPPATPSYRSVASSPASSVAYPTGIQRVPASARTQFHPAIAPTGLQNPIRPAQQLGSTVLTPSAALGTPPVTPGAAQIIPTSQTHFQFRTSVGT